MRELLSSELLQELVAVEGRYIQWEWDPRTFQNDYISLREANGQLVVRRDSRGREPGVRTGRGAMQRLISEHSIYEDESRRAPGFRIYWPTEEGRSRCDFRKAS
jgi:hypothetical protein